jgi:hypothetical protein
VIRVSPGPVGVDDLRAVHLRHLRDGAGGVADAVRDRAAARDVTVAEVVGGIVGATAASSPEVAGWASVVVPFVQAAIEAGALVVDQPTSQSMRSPAPGV